MATNDNKGIEEFLKGTTARRAYNFGTQGSASPAVPRVSRAGFIDIIPSGTGAGAAIPNLVAPPTSPGSVVYRGRGGAAGIQGNMTFGVLPSGATSETLPMSPSAMAERGRVSARAATSAVRSARQAQLFPQEQEQQAGPGGPSVTAGIDKIFAPLFAELQQQRRNAGSRYTANLGQIENIYGQLIGTRSADIGEIDEAYKRLQAAAATRSEQAITDIGARDTAQAQQSQAVAQSMGLGALPAADYTSEQAQTAQNVEELNQANWANLLGTLGATAQEIARADVAGYGYRQGEDVARLQAAKEDYFNELASQRFGLISQREQARQQAIASAASAANKAASQAAKGQAAQFEQTLDYLKYQSPDERAIGEEVLYRGLSDADQASVRSAYNTFISTNNVGRMGLTAPEALAKLNDPGYSKQLSPQALATLKKAILYTLNQ